MLSYVQIQFHFNNPMFMGSSLLNKDSSFQTKPRKISINKQFEFKYCFGTEKGKIRHYGIVCNGISSPMDCLSIASHLSALSLFPYMGFLYFITKSKSTPRLTLFGFYFLLVFVAAAIPAGLYAKVHYMTFLSNVDWLHGGAESLLTLTNLFIVLGLREALRKAKDDKVNTPNVACGVKEEDKSSISI